MTLLNNYLHGHYQRVLLNGQTSSMELIKSGVPQWLALTPLQPPPLPANPQFFFIYIINLPENLQSNCKIFDDESSLFTKFLIKDQRFRINKQLGFSMEFQRKYRSILTKISKLKNYIFLKKPVTKHCLILLLIRVMQLHLLM